MNIKEAFIDYLIGIDQYRQYCCDKTKCTVFIEMMKDEYIKAFNSDPFDVNNINSHIALIRSNLQKRNNSFVSYNQKTGSGVPHAILNKHLIDFLTQMNSGEQEGSITSSVTLTNVPKGNDITHTKKIKVGVIQQANTADLRTNLMNLAKSIESCTTHGAQLVVLQELHNSLYFCQTENTQLFDLAEPIPGPSTGFYSELAASHQIVLVTSLFEKRAPGLYHNTAVVFDRDGSMAGKYRKMHIPDDPAYYEKFYFTPGDLGFQPIQTSLGKLGVLVCWDQWYPEAARLMALRGAEILIYPTAIGWESSDTEDEKRRQLNAWIISQRGHAVANGLPVVSVNRVGHEPDPSGQTRGIQFWGNSFVAGPQGELLAQASNDRSENMVVEVDMERSENVRRWWPFLRDRRIDAYEGITRRFLDE